jgi:hypothetical protein
MVLPVVDSFLPGPEQYLPRDPKEVLQTGNYVTMPVLTGTTRHEGAATLCAYQNKILQNSTWCLLVATVFCFRAITFYLSSETK